jgi:transcription antitermination factor NusB
MGSRTRRSTTPRRSDTSDPSRSRERALRVLFQADLRGVEPTVTLSRLDTDADARSLLDERDTLTDTTPIVPPPATDEGGSTGRPPGERGTHEVPSDRHEDDRQRHEAGPTPARSTSPGTAGSGWTDEPARAVVPELDGFTRTLVRGVEAHRAEVETLIARYSRRWAIARMPVVDRNVLRLATYELLHESTPPAVVIDEAVALAKRLSTDDSGRFVNGVLESIRKDIAETRHQQGAQPEPGQ